MKKNKLKLFFLTIVAFLTSITMVNAREEENLRSNRNKVIEADNATRVEKFMNQAPSELKELFAEDTIISPDWFDKNGNLLPLVSLEVSHIETRTFVSSNGDVRTIERRLTAQEYVDWEAPTPTRASCESVPFQYHDCWETNAKRLTIAIMGNGAWPNYRIVVKNEWKTMPSVRSFDSIGLLYNGFVMTKAWGYQYYNTTSNHALQNVSYGYKGTNMKIGTSPQGGVTISQNIIDNLYNQLQNELWVDGTMSGNSPYQYTASYQHAVTSIDLATSHNFVFHPNGMGRVFYWAGNWNKWDNMQGVCVNLSYPTLWLC